MSGWVHPINRKWKLIYEPIQGTFEPESIDLFTDKLIFSTAGQIQQLENIKFQVDRLIIQLKAVNSFISGCDDDDQGGDL